MDGVTKIRGKSLSPKEKARQALAAKAAATQEPRTLHSKRHIKPRTRSKWQVRRAQKDFDGHWVRRAPLRRSIRNAIQRLEDNNECRQSVYRIYAQTEEVICHLLEKEMERLVAAGVFHCMVSRKRNILTARDIRQSVIISEALKTGASPGLGHTYAALEPVV